MSIAHRSKRMSLILSISAMTLGFASLNAQDVPVRRPVTEPAPSSAPAPTVMLESPASANKYHILAGLNIYGKAGMNTNPADGRKTAVDLITLPDINASIMVPFTKEGKVGLGLDFGFNSVGYINKQGFGDDESIKLSTIHEQYTYFQVFPHINAYGFLAGVSFGTPNKIDAYSKNVDNTPAVPVTSDGIFSFNELGHLQSSLEVRVGGSVPVIDDNMIRLSINIMAGYALNGLVPDDKIARYVYSSNRNDNGTFESPSIENNPKPVTLGIGISCYYKIPLGF